MLIKKFGLREADEIPLHTYAEAGRLDSFSVHAGDAEGVLDYASIRSRASNSTVFARIQDLLSFAPTSRTSSSWPRRMPPFGPSCMQRMHSWFTSL